jgi:hypothetical protein
LPTDAWQLPHVLAQKQSMPTPQESQIVKNIVSSFIPKAVSGGRRNQQMHVSTGASVIKKVAQDQLLARQT